MGRGRGRESSGRIGASGEGGAKMGLPFELPLTFSKGKRAREIPREFEAENTRI